MALQGMYSAISGLQSESSWLDVIGNNISNVNTVAYKGSQVEFGTQFSQSLSGGLGDNPSNGSGGTDPEQIGLGTRVASIDTVFAQGTTMVTGNATDISIQGDGFLLAKQGDQTYLTRAGNLTFDSQGYLVDSSGGLIQGFPAQNTFTQEQINTAHGAIVSGGVVVAPPTPNLFVTSDTLQINNSNIADISDIQINPDMTMPPKATTVVNFQGNLDSFQQANQPGGVFGLFPPQGPTLPVGLSIALLSPPVNNAIDTRRMNVIPNATFTDFNLQQVTNLSTPEPGYTTIEPLLNGFIDLGTARAGGGNYAWEEQPPLPPACETSETVYDSLGNAHTISVLFYQVNDLGTANPPVNPSPGPSQACYAWYAFDTTGGQPIQTANLIGGTGVEEGDFQGAGSYDRNTPNELYGGDFIWFNTDGSLASTGGVAGIYPTPAGAATNFESVPRVYLPLSNLYPPVSPIPYQGAEVMAVDLNFGTAGFLGIGQRNGMFSDAEGSYQTVNGVNTYVPHSDVEAVSQNGYADGTLQSLSFDNTGTIQGKFTNGQTVGLGQVVLANVENPEGLNNVGENYYSTSPNTGAFQVGLAGQNGLGLVQGGSLEGSNVDLSVELTNMIIAQRGFESNARMITTVNDLLNTLRNLGL